MLSSPTLEVLRAAQAYLQVPKKLAQVAAKALSVLPKKTLKKNNATPKK
jgi:hypothetical protein